MSTQHLKISGVADAADTTKVRPQSDWNAKHVERCGRVTLVAGQKAVLFSDLASGFNANEPDTSYSISLSGDSDEAFYWASKATTGFTIKSSNGASTANVDWKVSRHQ